MNISAIKSFVTRFKFISEMINYQDYELNILNIGDDGEHISFEFRINNGNDDFVSIPFETSLVCFDNLLVFNTIYQKNNKIFNERNVFALVDEKQSQYYNSKTKLLIHFVDNDIRQAYRVGRKYNFNNGLSESFGKMNMNSREIIKELNAYKEEIQYLYSKNEGKRK